MSTDTRTIKATVADIMDRAGVTMTTERIPRRTDCVASEWDKDAGHWRVRLSHTSGREIEIEYSMGSGHRVWKCKPPHSDLAGIVSDPSKIRKGDRVSTLYRLTLHAKEVVELFSTFPDPDPADVLYSLILDSSACDMSHSDWCDEYGYDPDSIKAKDIWMRCVENGHKLRGMLGDSYSEIEEVLWDY